MTMFDDEITYLTGISNFQVIVPKKYVMTYDSDTFSHLRLFTFSSSFYFHHICFGYIFKRILHIGVKY